MHLRARLTYANLMVTILAFLVLGGGVAYATIHLPENSVGTKQLKDGAVTAAKVKAGSLLAGDFAAGQIPAGPAGPAGPRGEAGPPGAPGESGSLPATLPSGKTLKGFFSYSGHYDGGTRPTDAISYQLPLAAAPTPNVVQVGAEPTEACPGTSAEPLANSGQLCIYEAVNLNNVALEAFTPIGTGKFGAGLLAQVPSKVLGGVDFEIIGTWAVTAP